MKLKGIDKGVKIIALTVTIIFSIAILIPLLYTISTSLKDDNTVLKSPARILPKSSQSINVVFDYSNKDTENNEELLDSILKDGTIAMYMVPYELETENISEIKVFGIRDGKTIFYSRAHTGLTNLIVGFGVYRTARINKDVLIFGDRYKKSYEEIGYKFDPEGLGEEYSDPKTGTNTLNSAISDVLTNKYPTEGKLLGTNLTINNWLMLERYKYYFELPQYAYTANPIIAKFSFFAFIGNTLIVVLWAVFTQVLLCSLTAFALSRLFSKIMGNRILLFFLITMMIPGIATIIPTLVMFKEFGWFNNYKALLIPQLVPYAYFIFLFKGFFDRLPNSLFDAARVDGASEWFNYIRLCIPLSKPIISLVALNTFLANWNDFFWAWLVTQKQSLWTLNVALFNISNIAETRQNFIMGLSIVTVLPVIIISAFFSEQIKQSIAMSGIKG